MLNRVKSDTNMHSILSHNSNIKSRQIYNNNLSPPQHNYIVRSPSLTKPPLQQPPPRHNQTFSPLYSPITPMAHVTHIAPIIHRSP